MSGCRYLTVSSVYLHRRPIVTVLKDGYAPFTTTVTVADGQTAPVTATLSNEDLDEDGLPDGFENGYRDEFGRWHTPYSSLIDTDGDRLSPSLILTSDIERCSLA